MTEDKKEEVKEESAPEPKIVKVFGKEFNVNDPLEVAQLQAWDEAMRSMQGKQSNELGELRKLKKQIEPALDNSELKKEVKRLSEEGDHEALADLLLVNQAKAFGEFQESLEAQRANDKAWGKYFAGRKDLLDTFGEDVVRSYSEQNLGVYDAEDFAKVVDSYWLPKLKSEKTFQSAQEVDTNTPKEPRTAAAPKGEPTSSTEETVTLDDIFGPEKL